MDGCVGSGGVASTIAVFCVSERVETIDEVNRVELRCDCDQEMCRQPEGG